MSNFGRFVEFTEYISPDSQTYAFEGGTKFLMSESGLGMPPIKYISQRGPYQHGETIYDYRLDPREIQIVHRSNSCSRIDYWNLRCALINYLRPNRQTLGNFTLGALRKTLEDGSQRQIDVFIQEGPVFEARDLSKWDEWSFTETLRFIAPDPTFYDPIPFVVNLIGTSGGGSTVPPAPTTNTSNNLIFHNDTTGAGYTSINFKNAIYNANGTDLQFGTWTSSTVTVPITGGTGSGGSGTGLYTCSPSWHSYPVITIIGPIKTPTITNTTTSEVISLSYNVAAGETVTINTAYGNKTVTSSVNGNIIGTVTTASDLATFHIACSPEATGGINSFTVAGNDMSGATAVYMTYYARYIGI